MAALSGLGPEASVQFTRLRRDLGMTAGNLSTHLRKLEDAQYLGQTKSFEGRVPATYIQLTPAGRAAYDTYLQSLRAVLGPRTPVGESI